MNPIAAKENIVAIIEARMSSNRLPGKVLMTLAGEPVLAHIVRRAKTIHSLSQVVIATTTNPRDDAIVAFAQSEEVAVFRGSEKDVLGRVFSAARAFDADAVLELTGDNPILDCKLAGQLIRIFKTNQFDLVTNNFKRTFPMGVDMSMVSMNALSRSASEAKEEEDREHVLRFIHQRPRLFSIYNSEAPPEMLWPSLALTLDEADDLCFLSRVFEDLFPVDPMFGLDKVIAYLQCNPNLVEINRQVKRRFL